MISYQTMQEAHETDDALLTAWRAGDRRAGSRLFQRHFPSLKRFFHNKVPAGEEDDLIQNTMIGCVESATRFEGQSSFRTFLFRIAHNKLADYYRKKWRSPKSCDFDQLSVAESRTGLSTLQLRHQRQALLLESLRALSMNDQIVLELYYWEPLSAREIGLITGQPEPAVRSRIRRAKERLLEAMKSRSANPKQLRVSTNDFEKWADEMRALSSPADDIDGE